jgi:hypothetical protein
VLWSLLADVVEKVARSVGIVLLDRFDPAELSRLLGLWPLDGGDFDAERQT